jgi:hypothetical protein
MGMPVTGLETQPPPESESLGGAEETQRPLSQRSEQHSIALAQGMSPSWHPPVVASTDASRGRPAAARRELQLPIANATAA